MISFKIKKPTKEEGQKAPIPPFPHMTTRTIPRSTSRNATPKTLAFFRSLWNEPLYEVTLWNATGTPTLWVFDTPDNVTIDPGEYDCILLDRDGEPLEFLVIGVDYMEPEVGWNEDNYQYEEL